MSPWPSNYYSTLHEYADDELTLLKTSLVEPWDGLPPECRLPFHKTHFSAMQHIPHISVTPEPTSLQGVYDSKGSIGRSSENEGEIAMQPLDDAPRRSPKPGSSHLGSVASTFSSQEVSAVSSLSSLLSQAHDSPKNASVSAVDPAPPPGSPSVIVQAHDSPSCQQAWEIASTTVEDLLCPSEDEDARSLITKVSFPDHALPEIGSDTVKQTETSPFSHTAREEANVSIRAPKPLSPDKRLTVPSNRLDRHAVLALALLSCPAPVWLPLHHSTTTFSATNKASG
jgi:hypothetical protein